MTSPRVLAEWSHDPDTCSSRTSAGCSPRMVGTLFDQSLTTWPRSGSMRSGCVSERPTWVPRMSDCDGSVLLKTSTAQLAINGGSQHPTKRKEGGHGPTLADEVEHLLPTPAVNDMGAGKTVEAWDEWTAKMQALHGNGNGHGKSLAIEAQRLLPTPSAADGLGGHLSRSGDRKGELLLGGVAKSIGAPTRQPSTGGPASPDGPHPHPSEQAEP